MPKSKLKQTEKEQKKLLHTLSLEIQELFLWYTPQEAEDLLLEINEWANTTEMMNDQHTRSSRYHLVSKLKHLIRACGKVAI